MEHAIGFGTAPAVTAQNIRMNRIAFFMVINFYQRKKKNLTTKK
jgi:hypothetical protein